jgi:hypothetical protein
MDDLLPGDVGETLGRLLIDFQELEAAVRSFIDVAFEPVDPLAFVAIWTKEQTVNRKIETANRLLRLATEKYAIAEVEFVGTFPVQILEKSRAAEQVRQAFAAARYALADAASLLGYRNNLFHGQVKAEGTEIRFEGAKPGLRGGLAEFAQKRQDVLATIFNVLLAASSVRTALAYLITSDN